MLQTTLHTDGGGLWSNTAKAVEITGLELHYVNDEVDFGELRVYFTRASWDVFTLGLIYSDRQFEAELRAFLTANGLAGEDVTYSEQGMQGDDFVSCDVGEAFIFSWGEKWGIDSIRALLDVDIPTALDREE